MAVQPSDNPTDLFKQLRGKSPEEAKFFWSGGPVEVAERTWFQSVFSGCTGFETDEGLVLVDSGMVQLGGKLAALLRRKTGAPVHTAIFTHGHVDHAFGLEAFLLPGQKPPRVIAHRAVAERFVRYERTRRRDPDRPRHTGRASQTTFTGSNLSAPLLSRGRYR
jgi:glyoxylase-like metal-dependent hydrolase (beta-lactamase superfamily II)